ncbi:MAG: hypoxanthine phosphoribosyltransferase [Eubacteriales bacterium]|nr:hypoxanthine phosphoribosyltransferase [Clostridiales bacterium]MDY3286982.1 hypoxanthine phosphoribosyltransferase [Eubacteriales bacterium]MDY5014886.1 hypoxanthine phosphoribosyltransferase [Eubacteriales bacterium]
MHMVSAADALQEILISESELRTRVTELGEEIRRGYEGLDGRLLVVGMLKGSFIFLADLVRAIDLHCEIDFMAASSYGNSTESSGQIRVTRDIKGIEGQHVLIVEDIVDSGYTMDYILRLLRSRNPASVKLVSLLDKPSRRRVPVQIDYCGFEIEDKFVVGYGLDFAGMYRNLPFIGVLKPECYR